MPSTATSAFLQDLKELPAQNLVTGRLLAMLDDEHASASDLGKVIESDPALSTQVMRLANSPFNGLMKQVDSAARAVMVLGFTTVRTLAVSAVCNLSGGRVSPPGFWVHSVTVGAACAEVARLVRIDPSQAFSVGLLHDLGSALLFRHDDAAWGRVTGAGPSEADGLRVEVERFEVTHADVGGAVLEGCHFPPGFVRAVTEHHLAFDELESALGRILVAGEAVADVLTGATSGAAAASHLELLGVEADVDRLAASVQTAVESLSGFLTEG